MKFYSRDWLIQSWLSFILVKNNKEGGGGLKEKGHNNFLLLERGHLVQTEGLFERGGGGRLRESLR